MKGTTRGGWNIPSTRNDSLASRIGVSGSAIGALLLAASADAHHSFNMFDMQSTLTLEGRVTDFDYVNPHGYITVEVTDEQGEAVVWRVETISALIMSRRGIARDSLTVGEWVRIDARPPRNAERRFANGEVVHKLDGAELVVGFQQGQADLEAPPPAVAACVPYSPPVLMLAPVAFVVEIGDDVVSIGIDYPGARRTIQWTAAITRRTRRRPTWAIPSDRGRTMSS